MAAAANSLRGGAQSSEQGPLLFGPLLLLSAMTFVGRKDRGGGVILPQGREKETERQGEAKGGGRREEGRGGGLRGGGGKT